MWIPGLSEASAFSQQSWESNWSLQLSSGTRKAAKSVWNHWSKGIKMGRDGAQSAKHEAVYQTVLEADFHSDLKLCSCLYSLRENQKCSIKGKSCWFPDCVYRGWTHRKTSISDSWWRRCSVWSVKGFKVSLSSVSVVCTSALMLLTHVA